MEEVNVIKVVRNSFKKEGYTYCYNKSADKHILTRILTSQVYTWVLAKALWSSAC